MILVGAEFLGLVYLMVYVGALAVLFLFVIMMLNVRTQLPSNEYNANMIFLAVVPVVAVTFIFYKANVYENFQIEYTLLRASHTPVRMYSSVDRVFLEHTNWFHFEHATREDHFEFRFIHLIYIAPDYYTPSPEFGEITIKFPNSIDLFYEIYRGFAEEGFGLTYPIKPFYYPSSNIQALGFVLYLKYFLGFLSAGLILFVSMLGAILLTKYKRPSAVRTQQISLQNAQKNNVQKYRVPYF